MLFFGIDIGKTNIYICKGDNQKPARKWEVTELETARPDFERKLLQIIPPGATIALEPTGWHYSQPVINTLTHNNRQAIEVAHRVTKQARIALISTQKTDTSDARALAVIAQWWSEGRQPQGAHLFNTEAEKLNVDIRLAINAHRRAARELNQNWNRLMQFAHAISPQLTTSPEIFYRAVLAGAVTPQEIQELAHELGAGEEFEAYPNGHAKRHLYKFASRLERTKNFHTQLIPAAEETAKAIQKAKEEKIHWESQLEHLIHHPQVEETTRLWFTIPHAGTIAIATVLAATHCRPTDYTRDTLRAAVGSHPSRQESGAMQAHGKMKKGYHPAKAALHMWTQRLLTEKTRPNPIATYYDKLKRKGHKRPIHAARGKLAQVLAGIARTGKPCNWPKAQPLKK